MSLVIFNSQQSTTKKLIKSLSFLSITSVLSLSAVQAQVSTPTTESVNQLISLTPTDKILVNDVTQQAYAQNVIAIPQIVEEIVYRQKIELSETQKKQLERIINDYAETFGIEIQSNTKQTLSNQYIKSIQQIYTQEEVDAQVVFYSSAVGQKILQKQPQLLQSYMRAILPSLQIQIKSTMQELIPKLKADVNQVIN